MMNASRRISICGAVISLALFASVAAAQTATTAIGRQLERIDLGVSGIGQFTNTTSGTTYLPQNISQTPSNTLGALIELRFTKSPLIGFVFNYSYARYTENYTVTNTTGTPVTQKPYVLGVQSKATEYTIGYVAHGPQIFGVIPFASVGGGGMEFKPTTGGGQGLPTQVRGAFYYGIGAQQTFFNEHFGLRAQFRQVFLAAPDFNQNYLSTDARTITSEPSVGFYLRF
jgi:hypothetical protein